MSKTREQLEAIPAETFKEIVLEGHKEMSEDLRTFSGIAESVIAKAKLGEFDGLTIIITITNDPEVIGEE